ncbi:MAG: EamA family transporter [Ktedonobacteraceae bacterium]
MRQARRGAASRLVGYILVMAAAVMFGINGSLSRLLFNSGVTPLTLVEFRMIVGGICLLGYLLVRQRHTLKLSRRALGWLIAFGLVVALVTYTYYVSISRIPIAVTLVIQFTGPAWMALVGAIWRKSMPSWYVLGALGLTIGGVVLVTGAWQQNVLGLDGVGLLFAVFALLTFIAYLMLGRQVGKYLPSTTGTAYGAIIASLFWLVVQPPWSIPASTWHPQTLALILLVGIIGMALPFSLELAALRRLEATHVGIVSMFELPASALIALFWLGQSLDLWQVLGCVLVLAGVTIVQLERDQSGERAEKIPQKHLSQRP